MCSVQDGHLEEPVPKPSALNMPDRKCVKCQRKAVLITRINDAFCRDCFQVYVVHKFRASIGKSKLIRDGEHVLVAYSGGPSSSALLHLIQEGRSPRAHRKLRFTATVIHIDETGILNLNATEREAKLQEMVTCLKQREFPVLLTSLEQLHDLNVEEPNSAASSPQNVCWDMASGKGEAEFRARTAETCHLQEVFAALASDSVREEFLRVTKTQLLVSVAKCLGFDKVLAGECSSRLSVRILSDMAEGRGSQIPLDTTIGDKRYGDVMVIRPLRDLNSKEVAMYNVLNQVDTVFTPSITTKTVAGSSIEHLTETFITGLQANYPATVPNIVRTSEKLDQTDLTGTASSCAFCQSPLDTEVGEASAMRAVQVSEHLSQGIGVESGVGTGGSGSVDVGSQQESATDSLSAHEIQSAVCYGCWRMIKSVKNLSFLPPVVLQRARTQRTRQTMHQQIAEFLLEENAGT